MKRKLVIATRNEKKFKEIKRLFRGSGISILSLKKFPRVPEVIEDGETFNDNAIKKALVVSNRIDRLVLADDSGLEVDVLDRKPGVHSSRYAGPKKDDSLNIKKLLRALKSKPLHKRVARFRCVIALADKGRVVKLIEGVCEGRIGLEREGSSGFGYDPVFIPKGYKESFSQLGPDIKDRLSHRAKALRKARKAIQGYFAKAL
jgi:XTP/dITP diphosphohydrolase